MPIGVGLSDDFLYAEWKDISDEEKEDFYQWRRLAGFEHIDDVDLSTWTLEELYIKQEELHVELAYELDLAGKEI